MNTETKSIRVRVHKSTFLWIIIIILLQLESLFVTNYCYEIDDQIPEMDVHAFVSKVEQAENQSYRSKISVTTDIDNWSCDCYNPSTDDTCADRELDCECYGKKFLIVPKNLGNNLTRLTIMHSEMEIIRNDSLQPYNQTLTDVTISHLYKLKTIESGTFANLDNLRTIYISHTTSLIRLDGLFYGSSTRKFLSLRVAHSALNSIPDFTGLATQLENVINMIDLENNKIRTLERNCLKIEAAAVYNNLIKVDSYAFNGSRIGKLSFFGNKGLKDLDEYAFRGLRSLRELDLSDTSIEQLPTDGLSDLEILKIEKTPSMKTIPSIYLFKNLQKAFLTHPFHCCAFKYPKEHDPVKYAEYQDTLKLHCDNEKNANFPELPRRRKRQSFEGDIFRGSSINYAGYRDNPNPGRPYSPNPDHTKGHPNNTDHSHLKPLKGRTIARFNKDKLNDDTYDDDDDLNVNDMDWSGTFHEPLSNISTNGIFIEALCGNFVVPEIRVICKPEPDALNPCEDMMGSNLLRISVWFVLILAIIGNLAVIIVVLFSGGELCVSRFLMCNLAFADICMGIYLILIASMDIHSVGSYFNSAYDWQYGFGCKIAGFLTVFSSHLSVFTLTIITLERWFAIAHAIYLTRRINLKLGIKLMGCGWIYSIFMASLPLFGASNYSSTSICLPMEANEVLDKVYLFVVILLNGIAFILIVFCYAQIYFSLTYETRHARGEGSIAKKMALLVFTDFICWAPIAFFSLTALAGYPLMGVTESKILLVFFYPLNSCANPYLYAIMTSQYRKDLYALLSRFGICKEELRKCTMNTSLPVMNNGHPVPLIPK